MSGAAFKAKLARIDALRGLDDLDAVAAGVRKALSDRSNYVIAKAAAIAGSRNITAVIPDLIKTYDGLFGAEAAVVDPLVLGKQAIAQALTDLDHREPEPYVRGLAHVQFEKTWGGSEDRAGQLRATCAHALVACHIDGRERLNLLLDHLVDPDTDVRVEVVRAVAHLGGPEGMLLLRLKALTGDREAEVLGACLRALLEGEPRDSVAFVERFLASNDAAIVVEAAAALAESRVPAALDVVCAFWQADISLDVRRAIVFSCGASPLARATELLLAIVGEPQAELAEAALEALAASRFRHDVRERAQATVERSGVARLIATAARAFGPPDERV